MYACVCALQITDVAFYHKNFVNIKFHSGSRCRRCSCCSCCIAYLRLLLRLLHQLLLGRCLAQCHLRMCDSPCSAPVDLHSMKYSFVSCDRHLQYIFQLRYRFLLNFSQRLLGYTSSAYSVVAYWNGHCAPFPLLIADKLSFHFPATCSAITYLPSIPHATFETVRCKWREFIYHV